MDLASSTDRPDLLSSDPALQAWLEPVSDDAPCGPDLEYDNDFLALTQAAAGKPSTTFSEAEPPDWRSVRSLSEDLVGRTRDLRVANLWLRARLRLDGFSALPGGLALFTRLLSGWWDELHPRPEDGDAFARVNVLTELTSLQSTLGDVRASLVLNDRGIGQISVRDIEIATGDLAARDDESPRQRGAIESMLADATGNNPEVATQATNALAALDGLVECLSTRLGYGEQPDFAPLRNMLECVAAVSPRPAGSEDSADAGLGDGAATDGDAFGADDEAANGRGRRAARSAGLGSVDSRADAVRAIDLVCAYLEKNEPTNPAADLLRRAQRLIDLNFLQLVREFAPEAVAEVARVLGVDPASVEPQ